MARKITIQGSNLLQSITDPWGGVNNTQSPITVYGTSVPAGAEWGMNRGEVERFIKATFGSKAGEFYYDGDTVRYLIFADVASRNLYLSDRETYADLLIGSFDAPANYTAEITMTTPSFNAVLEGSTDNYIDFTFDIVNKSGGSTGEAVLVTYSFNNGGNVKTVTQVYNAGTNVHFLIDEYISAGVNNISIVVTGKNTLASVMASVNYTVVSLKISSDFPFTVPVERGNFLSVTYTLEGSGVKYLEWYIDGVKESNVDTVSDVKITRTKNLSVDGLADGKHNVQVRPYTVVNGTNFYGQTLYFDFLVCPVGEAWNIAGTHLTYTLLGLALASPCLSTPSIQIKQYEKFAYKLGLYDYRRRALTVNVTDNNEVVQTLSMSASDIVEKDYIPATVGNHTITFDAGENAASFVVVAAENDMGVREESEDVLLKLSAKGRNNNEVNPAVWSYQNISATFSGINWDERSGWINDALVVPVGGYVNIPFAALGNNPLQKGRTIEIEYEVADVDNDDAVVLNLINSQSNAGVEITATSAKMQSSGGAQVNTKFRDGDRLRLSFIINRIVGDDARLMFIVNNGILERVANFEATDNFNVTNNLRLGSNGCIVKIYNILVYDKALTVEQAFGNYAVNAEDIIDVVDRNDVLNTTTGQIDADKVNTKIPVLVITGDMQPIFDATDKNTTVYVDVEYTNLQDNTKNFRATHLRMRPQGTSSLGYPRKNLRLYTSDQYGCTMYDSNGDIIPNGKYAFKDNAQPVDCWTLKADYAESSGSHNTGVARLWNKLMYDAQVGNQFPLRTTAQVTALANNYGKDVRTAIDGFPIVVFHRVTAESELTCLGQYNFNNDKSTESVFGFVDIPGFDNSHVQCFEVLGNEEPLALFTDVSTFDSEWSDAYESRYPDTKSPNLNPLKTLCTWVNACQNNQAKWNAEKAYHFDIPKLAAYYVYLMRFGAVDQTVKNSMLTTEDGTHWFYINYDNDTVLGIDNISTVLNRWDYDRTTAKVGGGYIYAGHSSVLWNCFEADSECMSMAHTIDDALYSAGLTYNNMLKMFDEEQCDKWCERIYNDNGVYKYIIPFKEQGAANLYMLQGSRKSYRHWWLKNRMEMYDAKWGTGAYKNRVVRFIAEGAPSGSQFTIGASKTSYFGYGINAVVQESGVQINKNATHEFTISQALAIGDPISVYNANNINIVDLSKLCTYMTTLYLQQALDNDGNSAITKLLLGDGTHTNLKFTEIGGLAVITTLEEIDIRGFQAMNSINLSALNNLHVLKALGSGLTSFVPAAGCSLTNVEIPSSVQTIILNDCAVASMTVEDYDDAANSALRSVTMNNISGAFDVKAFVLNWIDTYTDAQLEDFSLTLEGIAWTNFSADELIHLGHIGTKNLKGSVSLMSMSMSQYEELVELFGGDAFRSYSQFRIIAPAGIYLTGPSELKYGEEGTFVATVFPDQGEDIKYLLYNSSGSLVSSQTDEYGRVYRQYSAVRLYELSGAISMTANPAQNVSVKVRARVGTTEIYSSYIDFTGKPIAYPNITISGQSSIDRNGTYNYTRAFSGTYNARVSSVAWSLATNNVASLDQQNTTDEIAVINAYAVGATSVTVRLTYTVTFTDGYVKAGYKDITFRLSYPSSLSISGDASINANGDYVYTKLFNTNDFTAEVLGVSWNLTSSEYAVVNAADNNSATIRVAHGNPTAATLTLTCTAILTGNVTVSGTKNISVAVIAAPPNEDWIDMGLPSGILWCKHNVGAITDEGDGLFAAWGEAAAYVDADDRNSALGRIDGFTNNAYVATGGAAITDAVLTIDHDAAQASMGLDWRLPTYEDFQELINACNWAKVGSYIVFTNKTDNTKKIRFKLSGRIEGLDQISTGTFMQYLGATKSSTGFYSLEYISNQNEISISADGMRSYGSTIRAVREAPIAVDLGLPSGTLWADRNLGAISPEDGGNVFAWGELEWYKDDNDRKKKFKEQYGSRASYRGGFTKQNYKLTDAYAITGNLTSDNDAAAYNLGGNWRMPTSAEIQELLDNTNITVVTSNGVQCYKVENKNDSTKFILLPQTAGWSEESGYGTPTATYMVRLFSSTCAYATYLDYKTAYMFLGNFVSSPSLFEGSTGSGYSIRAVQ